VSTDPSDPHDPSDPKDPQDSPPQAPPTIQKAPGGDLSDPTIDLEQDSAITEEVEAPVPEPTPLFQPPPSPPPANFTVSMGRLFRFSLLIGLALGMMLAIPLCGDVINYGLPPILAGMLTVVIAARWEGPEQLNPQHIGLAGATVGVILGSLVAVGLGIKLWMQLDQIEPILREAAQGQFTPGQALAMGMVCLLPCTQLIYAGLGLASARWTLTKLTGSH